jgi:hypothetical protein
MILLALWPQTTRTVAVFWGSDSTIRAFHSITGPRIAGGETAAQARNSGTDYPVLHTYLGQ